MIYEGITLIYILFKKVIQVHKIILGDFADYF